MATVVHTKDGLTPSATSSGTAPENSGNAVDRGRDGDWLREAFAGRATEPCNPPSESPKDLVTTTRPSIANAKKSRTSPPNSQLSKQQGPTLSATRRRQIMRQTSPKQAVGCAILTSSADHQLLHPRPRAYQTPKLWLPLDENAGAGHPLLDGILIRYGEMPR